MTERDPTRDPTVVADPAWVWRLLWVVFPLAGAGLAVLLRLLAGWLAGLPGRPGPGWFRLLGDAPEPWATLVAVVVGLVAGLLFTGYAQSESLTVTVAGDRLTLARGERTTTLMREEVGAVFLDGRDLVVLGPDTAERARVENDQGRDRLERALAGHGYPWHAHGDPHRDAYRRWVPGLPDLPPGADALLRARERALTRKDTGDAAELRAELAQWGLVVRDEDTRQHWRRHG